MSGPCVLAANHASFFDPPVMAAFCDEELAFIARASLFSFFPFKNLLPCLNAIPVHPRTKLRETFERVGQHLQAGTKVLMFPEGTRGSGGSGSSGKKISPFKCGVIRLASDNNVPIVPVYIEGTDEIWPKNRFFPKVGGTIRIVFGSPVTYRDSDDRQAKAAELHTRVVKLSHQPNLQQQKDHQHFGRL